MRASKLHIFEESYNCIQNVDISHLESCNLYMELNDRDVFGSGFGPGFDNEYFHLLSKSAVNPDFGLFKYTSENNMLEINPSSGVRQPNHLSYFRFIGIIAGLAVKHKHLFDANLPSSFFKAMLDKPLVLEDMEDVDPRYYRSLSYIRENDPSDLGLTFCVNEDQSTSYELLPGGKKIHLKQENKFEFINLFIQGRLVSRIRNQMYHFKEGFNTVIKQDLIKPFNEIELKFLICGTEKIDIVDWKKNTIYTGGYNKDSKAVKLFWQVVESYNNEMRRKLVQFVTGSQQLPVDGFHGLYDKFTIIRLLDTKRHPQASTCFNELELPPYKTYKIMKEKLTTALKNLDTWKYVQS